MRVPVKVRAQAVGGKFIGPAVAQPPTLQVLVGGGGAPFQVQIDNSASGTVIRNRQAQMSPNPIAVAPPPQGAGDFYPEPGPYYLLAPAAPAGCAIVVLDLAAPTNVEFVVTAFSPAPVSSSTTVLIDPFASPNFYLQDPGIVVAVPGLYMPGFTAGALTGAPGNAQVTLNVTLQMLCGCPITPQPASAPAAAEPYWPSTEFDVFVDVSLEGSSSGPFDHFPMFATATNTFSATVPMPGVGNFVATVTATQRGTGNRATGSYTFAV